MQWFQSTPQYNYAVCLGNTNAARTSPLNGVNFLPGAFAVDLTDQAACSSNPPPSYGLRDVTDGLSNTLFAGEVRQGPVNQDLRGLIWWSPFSGFSANLGPNTSSPDVMQNFCNNQPAMGMPCVSGTTGVAARSKHVGGVQVLMGDGAVRFVSNNINLPTWQGLSTIQGTETLGAF